jgi:hypothetical protein
MIARATAPNRVGPESVFPDAGTWDFSDGLKGSPMASAPFWLALGCQIIIVFGYFWFYRKEQLCKCPLCAVLDMPANLFFSSTMISASLHHVLFAFSASCGYGLGRCFATISGLNCNFVALHNSRYVS